MTHSDALPFRCLRAITLHAQPYDITARGFYFDSYKDYAEKAAKLRNDYGDPVEEFEIQFIDGEAIDCELAKAIGINQANLADYFACVADWEKTLVIIAVGECGYDFDAQVCPIITASISTTSKPCARLPSSLSRKACSATSPSTCSSTSIMTPSPAIWPVTTPRPPSQGNA